MFFWKFTRSGKYSREYVSLIVDFHEQNIVYDKLYLSFEECKNILILLQDVEQLNGTNNRNAGILKRPYRDVVNSLNFDVTDEYVESRFERDLVLGEMVLGNHFGLPLDYGKDTHTAEDLWLDINNLRIQTFADATTGIIYSNEDKLKAFRREPEFIPNGRYFDLMPQHSCIIEIVSKMSEYDEFQTQNFLTNVLKWEKL